MAGLKFTPFHYNAFSSPSPSCLKFQTMRPCAQRVSKTLRSLQASNDHMFKSIVAPWTTIQCVWHKTFSEDTSLSGVYYLKLHLLLCNLNVDVPQDWRRRRRNNPSHVSPQPHWFHCRLCVEERWARNLQRPKFKVCCFSVHTTRHWSLMYFWVTATWCHCEQ